MVTGKCQVGQIVFAHEPYLHLINIRSHRDFNNGRRVISAAILYFYFRFRFAICQGSDNCCTKNSIVHSTYSFGPRLMSMSFDD